VKITGPLLIVTVPSAVLPSLNVTVPVAAAGETVAVNVTGAPDGDGFVEDVNATADACSTFCVSVDEVLLLSFASPPYEALIECDPTTSVEVLKVALPLLIVPVPSIVLPSLNVTVPVAAEGETVAVNVTEDPNTDGFEDEVTVVVLLALFTVCVSTADVLVL
jgi:hypothetical protein